MKRSGEFWLNCLSEDVREKWLKNYNPNFSNGISEYIIPLNEYLEKNMDFKDFIEYGFCWSNTSDGGNYWRKIYQTEEIKLIRNYKLIQLGL